MSTETDVPRLEDEEDETGLGAGRREEEGTTRREKGVSCYQGTVAHRWSRVKRGQDPV